MGNMGETERRDKKQEKAWERRGNEEKRQEARESVGETEKRREVIESWSQLFFISSK